MVVYPRLTSSRSSSTHQKCDCVARSGGARGSTTLVTAFAVCLTFLCSVIFGIRCSGSEQPAQTPPEKAAAIAVEVPRYDAGQAEPTPEESPEARARRVHFGSVVMDAHCDSIMRVIDDKVDLGVRSDEGHIDFVRMKEGGLDVQVFAVWVSPDYWKKGAKKRALDMIDAFDRNVTANPDLADKVLDVTSARRAVADGKIAAFLGIEGGHAIEDDPANIAAYYARGVRYMTLTWWNNTGWADGSGDKPRWGGLNDLGREIVREMNRVGMIVDVSHVSDDTFRDVMEVTSAPVIASHSNARALSDHHRNLSDEMLVEIARNGGVVGVNFVPGFLDADFARRSDALRGKLGPRFEAIDRRHRRNAAEARKERWALFNEEARALPPVTVDRVADHIDHIVSVAGIDHVGLGSDFDGFGVAVQGLSDCTGLPLVTAELVARGYSDGDISKILGGNFLRVFEKVIK